VTYTPKDRFFKKAKKDSFVARSVFKLEEIDRRHQLIERGDRIVDLGASPGSWMQYLAKAVGQNGAVVGYDLEPVRVAAGARAKTFVADVFELTPEAIRAEIAGITGEDPAGPVRVDAVLSDMAPKLSGIRDTDQARSIGLVERALELADALLRQDGRFVAKFFQGRDADALQKRVREMFVEVKVLRPEATREGSREAFIIAKGRRNS
jgi:23S rRNA (uridine2552-2'-O)-methyltransferase